MNEKVLGLKNKVKCIIAGGGTGGHLFPGIAIARELKKRFNNSEILFVVGKKKIETEILSRHGYETRMIDVEGIKGRGLKKGLDVIMKLPVGFFQSLSIINDFAPNIVIGMGGYSAGPFCMAAKMKGIPVVLHEQNSFPGLTNRLLSRIADRVLISFEESRPYIKNKSVFFTGNPVREEFFCDLSQQDKSTGFIVLVVGGSQGARAINEAVIEALMYLNKKELHINIIHQTGSADYDRVLCEYRNKGLTGEILPFIDNMIEAYAKADLVISRAGATTIFEMAAMGKPSVLIPYPSAANNHQQINAQSLVNHGGAEMILQKDLKGEVLADTIMKYMNDRELLEKTGNSARKLSRQNASTEITDYMMELIEK